MKLHISLTKIETIEDIKSFCQQLTEYFGLGWHPDTDFNEYRTGNIPFDETEAERLNLLMEQAFEISKYDDQVYQLGFASIKPIRHELGIGIEYED